MIHVYAIHLPDIDNPSACALLVERLLPLLTASFERNTPPLSQLESDAFPVYCSPEWEIARIRRFRHPADQLRALVGTLLLRSCVRQASGHWPRVFRTPFGKPVAQVPSAPQREQDSDHHVPISISHTGPWVVACVAPGQDMVGRIGIDITSADAGHCTGATDTLELYSPLLSLGERQWIADASTDLGALRRFASCWTIKEAVLKCLGSGLTGALEPLQLIERHPQALPSTTGEWQVVELVDQERLCQLPIPVELLPHQSLHVLTTHVDDEHTVSVTVEPGAVALLLAPHPICPPVTFLTVGQLIDMIAQT